jgi:predicted MFS family arabinose efflux permease
MSELPAPRIRLQLGAFSLTRTVLNTGFRMVYPFLPVIARGLGVDLQTVALAITARGGLGLFGPVLGSVADVRGRRTVMLFSLLLFCAGCTMIGLWPSYGTFVIGLLTAAAGKILFDPSMQAYLGERVVYGRRALAIAITELGWSGAFLIGVPLAGWMIARAGWSSPFLALAALGVVAVVILERILPPEPRPSLGRRTWRQGLRAVAAHRPALAGLAVGLLISTSNDLVNVIFGAWLEESFGLQVVALGLASAMIGIAELGGEGLVAGLADRMGKRRAVAAGVTLNAAACLVLPSLGQTLAGALVGLFLVYITFEFTLVSAIPMMSELVPEARATTMASNIGAHSAGRALGALLAPALFRIGLPLNSAVAAGLDLLALIILLRWVNE